MVTKTTTTAFFKDIKAIMAAIFAISILAALATPATAGKNYYRWQDDNGITHYGERPPKDRKYEVISGLTNLKGSAPAPQTKRPSGNGEITSSPGETVASKKNPQNCQYAKDSLQTIQRNARIRIQENGEYRFLSEAELAKKTADLKKLQKEAC